MDTLKPLMKVCNLNVYYKGIQVLQQVNLTVCAGQIVSIVGPNGSGKTTVMKAIAGILRPVQGVITYQHEPIQTLPAHEVVRRGLVYVSEGMNVFPLMSVLENLEVGAYVARKKRNDLMSFVFEIFPVLAEKRRKMAGTLSGGQKRMLTIARGLMSNPRLLLLDDPFLGLAPKDVNRLCNTLKIIRDHGITLFLAGQHVRRILRVATKAFLIENGKITLVGTGEQLLGHPHFREILFGLTSESELEVV
ncbi:MAG: ABC transporter ATP-binding protein [Deltaproteobacteria bacterium]|nr:ABC transporter ATP-binding protein [Deltaproteobacteria bacterium]MBW2680614.1 ABC transporter ATP-binding protein [Deltaproteobacteria bacterium]